MLGKLRKLVNSIAPATVGKALSRAGVKADYITYTGLALAVVSPLAVELRRLWALPLLVALSALMDVLDGAVARASGTTSRFGSYLDSMTDRVSDAFIFLALAMAGINAYLTMMTLAFSLMISYSRAKGELLGIKMEGVGIIERSERLIIAFVMALLLPLGLVRVDDIIMAALLLLSVATVVQRSVRVSSQIRAS